MDKIITTSGFEYQVEPDAADDLEVFEAIGESSSPETSAMGKVSALFRAFRMIIGEEQDKAVRAHLKEKNGKVRTSDYRKEAEEVFRNLGGSKKK